MPDQSTFIGNYYTAYVPNDGELIDLGYTVVRFYSAATEGGSYSLLGTATLVSGQRDYSYNDESGLATDWWYWAPYGATPGEGPASEPMPAGRPRYTRKQIRQAVGQRLGIADVYTLASVSSSTVGVISELIDPDASPHTIAGRWMRCSGGTAIGQTRRIRSGSTGYAVATGTITLNRATASAWVAGDEVELWVPRNERDPSADIDFAMQQARTAVWWEDTFYFTIDSQVTEYVMPASMLGHYVKSVEYVAGTYPSNPMWQPVPYVDFYSIGGTLYASVSGSAMGFSAFSAGTICKVTFNRFADRMDSDSDYWEVPLEWATAEVAAAYLRMLAIPGGNREDVFDSRTAQREIEMDCERLRRVYMPSPGLITRPPR